MKDTKLNPKLTAAECDALDWALDQAYADQRRYLDTGAFFDDYQEDERTFSAGIKAEYCRLIAGFCDRTGLSQGEPWAGLAADWEAAAPVRVATLPHRRPPMKRRPHEVLG